MDASPMPPALLRELSDLRRQAYGPDDGAAMERDALRRLGELEAMLHPRGASGETRALAIIELPPALVPPRVEDFLPAAPGSGPAPRHLRSPSQIRGLLQSGAVVSTIAAVVLATGIALVATAPHGEALLVATPATGLERQQLVDAVDLESFGLIGARLQQYEDFRGLSVWSAATARGVTCLLVGSDAGRPMGATCAPSPLRPSYDYTISDDTPRGVSAGLPRGSVIRFTWDDQTVGVWIAEAAVS
ncbi:hypothetical protein [Microbacterium sp. P02]|uniref:hypothetical protein n=1 Tax=unclassified Microbacterium TaxID=2609290 RepID=UPI003672DF66